MKNNYFFKHLIIPLLFVFGLLSYDLQGQTTVFSQNFQANDTGWDDTGQRDATNISGSSHSYRTRNTERGGTGNLNLTAYSCIKITFDYETENYSGSEGFRVSFNDGGGYTTVADYTFSGGDFVNNTNGTKSITVLATSFNFAGSNERVRIASVGSNNTDRVYIDNLSIVGYSGAEVNLQGNSVSIVDGDITPSAADHTDFGSAAVAGGTVVRTFTIQNLGCATLNLAAAAASRVTVSGTHAADFTVSSQPSSSTIATDGSLTFNVTFDPSASGARNATLTITNDDASEATYDFAITGTGTAVEINLRGNSTDIADGDNSPSSADHTDFGSADIIAATVARTFTIQNTGTATLNLAAAAASRVTVSGTHAADFTVTTQPSAATIAAGGNLTFVVTFNPSASGTRSATLTITNDDSDESPYNFDIQGTGLDREINIQGNSVTINDGDATPTTADHTDFGTVDLTAGTLVRTFTIQNTGDATLNLAAAAASRVTVSGAHAADFTVTAQPSAATIAAAGSLTFQVTFNPSVLGARNATLTITSDDANEATYDFAITGTGASIPDIDVLGNAVSIADGDPTPDIADHTDFGNVDVTVGLLTRDYTITNTGSADLTLAIVSLTGSPDFTIVGNPVSPVIPGGTTMLRIAFNPSSLGLKTGSISIPSDDADENPYNFDIQGTGANLPEISIEGNGVLITDGSTTPLVADDTDFDDVGPVTGSASVSHTFTIYNTGTANLNLAAAAGSRVTVSGTHAADFVVTTQPSAASIAAGGSLTFVVRFDPQGVGQRDAILTITNDDSDENPYTFNITGSGSASAPAVPVLTCPRTYNDVTVPAINTIVNTYHPLLNPGTLSANSDTIEIGPGVGGTDPITRGDLLLIMQMQEGTYNNQNSANYGDGAGGSDRAGHLPIAAANQPGRYEYVVALSDAPIGGGTLSITPTVNTYVKSEPSTAGNTDTGRARYQIIRVPSYNNLTIAAGASITTAPWNGETGGVVVLDVNGTLNMSTTGSINANELGFRGGNGRLFTACAGCGDLRTETRRMSSAGNPNSNGGKGEGIVGTPRYVVDRLEVVTDTGVEGYPTGSFSYGAPGNAGGGGNDGAASTSNSENTGGGGGGNGSSGGRGGNSWNSQTQSGGKGGAAVSFVDKTRLVMGGGGGGGGRNNAGPSNGSPGGGIVLLKLNTVTNAGSITANGKNVPVTNQDGGGGGGAGGSIYISATDTASLAGLSVSAVGGNGGDAWPLQPPGGTPGQRHGPGGGGGGGVILANGALGATDMQPGNSGITTTANDKYGSTGRGDAGITNGITDTGVPVVTYPPQATSCTDLAVTIESNNLAAAIGGTVTFTIYVTNNTASNATGVSIKDLLPTGYTFVSATGSYNSGTGVFTIGTVNAGATQSVTLTATVNAVPAGKNYMNTASLHRVDQMDINPTNNSDSTGLSSLWLKADAGTSTTTNNTALTTWNDQSIFGTNHATAGVTPDYFSTDARCLNFNPAVRFNGTDDRMSGPGGYSSMSTFAVIKPITPWIYTSASKVVIGANITATALDCSGLSIGNTLAAAVVANELFGNLRSNAANDVNAVSSTFKSTTSTLTNEILTLRRNQTLVFGSEAMKNGVNVTTTVSGSLANSGEWVNNTYRLGYSADVAGTGSLNRFYQGEMMEIISYPERLSTLDTRKIHTYLALKYGITMGAGAQYVNSTSAVVYDPTLYANRVFGMGRDSGTSLHQRQARSSDDILANTNAIVTIGNNEIISTTNNNANGNSLTNDGAYFVSGDNNGSIATWTATGAPVDHLRLTRIWKATETGTINERVRVRLTTSRLPAIPAGKVVVMIVTTAGSFATANYVNPNALIVKMSKVGSDWECNHNFPSGNTFYTFAIADGCYEDLICIGTPYEWTAGNVWSPGGTPTKNSRVTITGNYNTTTHGSFDACELIVNGSLTITNGTYVTLQSNITNNGTLTVENEGNLVQYNNQSTNSGNITLNKRSQNMSPADYTYWSSPVANFNLSGIPKNRAYFWNPNSGASGAWVSASGIMTTGLGYIVMTPNTDKSVPAATDVVFSGPLHNGRIDLNIVSTPSKWNLIGNPYPSAMDADEFLLDNAAVVEDGIYFWTHNSRINEYHVVSSGLRGQFSQSDYSIYNLSGGTASAPSIGSSNPQTDIDLGSIDLIGGGNGAIPDGYVATGQGFFVAAKAGGPHTLKINNCQRTHLAGTNNNFYKTKVKFNSKTRMWIDILNEEGSYKQILVGYFLGATDGRDGLYDAKTRSGSNIVSIYSLMKNDETGELDKFAIQGKALPFNKRDVIPLGLTVKKGAKINNRISLAKFEGAFEKTDVYLVDKYKDTIHNLKMGYYEFQAEEGEYYDRFQIVYEKNPDASSLDLDGKYNNVVAISNSGRISVSSKNSKMLDVKVYSSNGALLHSSPAISTKTYDINSVTPRDHVIIVVVSLENGEKATAKIIH
jgi:uncharacterized repeat protein (TIGR01451 family)